MMDDNHGVCSRPNCPVCGGPEDYNLLTSKFKPEGVGKLTLQLLQSNLDEYLPQADIQYDNNGQIVIYTNMMLDGDDVVPYVPDDNDIAEFDPDLQGGP